MKLTPKQALFIAEYRVDGNATRAAIAAGYAAASAEVTGSKLLKNRTIALAIQQQRARRILKLEEYAELIDQQLANASVLDVGRLYDADGKPIPIHLLDEDVRRVINAVDDVEEETQEGKKRRVQRVKLMDKLRSMELLGKRAGLFIDRSEVDARVTDDSLSDQERALRIAAILNAAKSRKNAA